MAANPYALAPLCVAQVDPSSGRCLRAYFFLGAVPKTVLEAARRGAARARGDPRQGGPQRPEWSAADGAILRGYYGAHWRELLTPSDPPAPDMLAARLAHGGPTFFSTPLYGGAEAAELDFGDLGEIDDIGKGRSAPADADSFLEPAPSSSPSEPAASAGPPVYSDIAVYPEDTIHDLRLKLRLASGAPPYRQHLFFYVNEEGPVVPYQLTVDGAPVVVDWRALARADGLGPAAPEASTLIAGIAVDPRLEERREGLHITALDTFTLLGAAPGVRVTRAYFVDLYAVIPPLGAAERPHDNLAAVLRDRYQFDLLYYGGLLKYWPQLSPDACSLALSEPARVGGVYPALDPDAGALQARFAAERGVADAAIRWRPAAAKGGRAPTAVTAATVRVAPEAVRMRVAVRNVFDWVPTGPSVAAAVARFEIDASLLSEAGAAAAGPEARQGGLIPVLATKRHASSYGPRTAASIDWFVSRAPRRDSVAFALAREAAADDQLRGVAGSRAVPYADLAIHADGRYEVTADWREDDRVGFEAVTEELAAVVAPTVAAVNAMGAAAFPVGGALAPLRPARGAAPASLGAITVSAFWPHALTAAAFHDLKDRFRVYERAGIVGIRGLQQAGAYAFAFRKGVVAYDPRLAERAEAGAHAADDAAGRRARGPSAANQYAWLTDPTAAARWAAAFQGRTVRIYHRATDLRVEIVGADSLAEFELIRRYVFSFLDGLLAGPGRLPTVGPRAAAPAPRPEREAPAASRRLRRLQERDPNLFDLKKYDQGATVYSVLCQSGRQPHVYNEAEARLLGAKRRAALVRYWNFTDDAPAFYECPDPKYPHLSFRAGQHPLGYCLPCCKKTRPAAGSRAALVNEGCLAQRAYEGAPEAETAMSRHVLTYGKAIPPGRISDPPREVGEGLFLDALPAPYRLQLVGVEQSAPAVPDAGYAYALAYALGLGDATTDDVLAELAATAAAMGDTFYQLGGGAGAVFATAGDLADAILGAFVRRDGGLSPFGPGGAAAGSWPAVLADLARHAYGVEVATLDDPEGTGDVSLAVSPEAAAAITGAGSACGYAPPRIALLVAGPMGTYPLAALNPKFFLRVPPAERWMAARRTFGSDARDARPDADELLVDRVAGAVRDALLSRSGPRGAGARLPDLALVSRYACAAPRPAFAVASRYINMRGLCYGVLLRGAAGDAYIPVRYSPSPVDGTPVVYGPRPAGALPRAALEAAVADVNAYVARAGEPYAPIAPAAVILDAGGRAIGFTHVAGGDALCFYHDPDGGEPPSALPAVCFPYDSRLVDEAIAEAWRGRSAAPERSPLAAAASGRNRLYRLFLAEFAAVLRADRNAPLRESLLTALKGARFESPKSVAALRRRLYELLKDYPEDLQAVREAVTRAYVAAPQDPGRAAAAAIEATTFSFDRRTVARLRAMASHGEVAAAVRELMAPRVVAVAGPARDPANVYVACSDGAAPHCEGRRLAVPADRLDDFYDILAADVRNPGKTGLLTAVSAGVFDPLDFIRRPGENLSIVVAGR